MKYAKLRKNLIKYIVVLLVGNIWNISY